MGCRDFLKSHRPDSGRSSSCRCASSYAPGTRTFVVGRIAAVPVPSVVEIGSPCGRRTPSRALRCRRIPTQPPAAHNRRSHHRGRPARCPSLPNEASPGEDGPVLSLRDFGAVFTDRPAARGMSTFLPSKPGRRAKRPLGQNPAWSNQTRSRARLERRVYRGKAPYSSSLGLLLSC